MILLVIIGAAPQAYSVSYSQNIQYGSTIYYTSYGGYGLPIPVNEKEVSVLEETSSDIIRIDMDETAWIIYLSNDIQNMDYAIPAIEAYDRVIEKIKKDNKKVFIADAGAELYRRNPVPWKTFKANQLAVFSLIASRYKPDYFEVVKEPDFYISVFDDNLSQISDRPGKLNVSEWIDFTAESINIIKSISPETKTVAGVSTSMGNLDGFKGENKYFNEASKIENLDILGISVYHPVDLEISKEYFLPAASGKPVWILETWWGINPDPITDAYWLDYVNGWAINNSIKGLITFNMYFFNQYDFNPFEYRGEINATFVNKSLDWRTPAFYGYKSIMERSNNNIPPVIINASYIFKDTNSNNHIDNDDQLLIIIQAEDFDGSIIRANADLSMLGNPYLNSVPLNSESNFFILMVPLRTVNVVGQSYPLGIPVEITDNTGGYTTEFIILSPEDVLLLLSKEIAVT